MEFPNIVYHKGSDCIYECSDVCGEYALDEVVTFVVLRRPSGATFYEFEIDKQILFLDEL